MTRRRKLQLAGLIMAVALVGVGYAVHVYRHIPEGYAAWDAGKVFVAFMQRNDGRWPTDWADLEQTWAAAENDMTDDFSNSPGVRATRIGLLKESIAVNWTFDPKHPDANDAFAPINGGRLFLLSAKHDPNAMVRDYLHRRASTQPTSRTAL